ncbi:fibrillin-1-like isoform X2 [Mercenaria mercenaria]|uniref:fibrillin-1-like isoform X2 n=1 Tax=Mercenaria mercenaria TaxID=6596 RepID=UPI00234F9017|nr:fibrillin-1-like isoform X2 [Mercenaria mercenaria]
MSRNINKRMNSLHWISEFYFMILLVFTRVRTVAVRDIDANGYNICDMESRTKCDMKTTYCRNFNGTYKCLCKPGYQETTNPYYCTDINECSWSEHYTCYGENNSSYCLNTVGSWECSCQIGFKARKITEHLRTCEDINECTDNDYSCHGGECINIPGGWYCDCPAGYTNESAEFGSRHIICKDINECLDVSVACLHASGCVNTVGSWKCICREGLKEKELNETSKVCTGEYQYVASMSFTLTGRVTDVGRLEIATKKKILDMYLETFNDTNVWIEMIKINGLPDSVRKKRSLLIHHEITAEYIIHTTEVKTQDQLERVEKVYKRENCKKQIFICKDHIDGYPILLSGIETKDQDAICETKINVCDKVTSTCSSAKGQLQCNCSKGYTKPPGENSLLCIDINECNNIGEACPNGTTCHNTAGSWECSCKRGLKAIETTPGKKECIDPCSLSKCYFTSTCKHYDNEDGYICGCQESRKGKYCQEIDHVFIESKFKTTLYVICGTLGGIALICICIIIGICRKRLPSPQNISSRNSSARQTISNTASSVKDIPLSNQRQRQEVDRSESAPNRGGMNKRNADNARGLQSYNYTYGQRADLTDYNSSHVTREEHQYETIRDDHVYETLHTYVNM